MKYYVVRNIETKEPLRISGLGKRFATLIEISFVYPFRFPSGHELAVFREEPLKPCGECIKVIRREKNYMKGYRFCPLCGKNLEGPWENGNIMTSQ